MNTRSQTYTESQVHREPPPTHTKLPYILFMWKC